MRQSPRMRRSGRDIVSSLCLLIVVSGLNAGAQRARAEPPRYPDIMPLSHVKAGMVGYGLTTFKGTTISRFTVTIIGILRKVNAGHDLILIRMKGGPITNRGANLIHGMSGSPIYVRGKIIGAFSMGEAFPKEPVGMVTPIEDMLESWDPDIPQRPAYFQPAGERGRREARRSATQGAWVTEPGAERIVRLSQPIPDGSRRIRELILAARPDDPRRSTAGVPVLRRATSLLCVTGLDARDREWLQSELNRRGYALTVTGGEAGSAPGFHGAALRPGSAFGALLATGDVEVGGFGTVTYRHGNRILAFGHPLMGLGAMDAAVSSCYIVDVFAGIESSHDIAIAGPVVGELTQDRDFSVSGTLGQRPDMVPVDITVNDETTRRAHRFHSDLFLHPDLTPLLLRLIVHECIARAHDVPGDVMARVRTTVDMGEVGSVTRSNVVFDDRDIAASAAQDLTEITAIAAGNPFYPLPIHGAQMSVDIMPGRDTATLNRIYLRRGRYAPGDTVDVGVEMTPYRHSPVTRTIPVRIPSDTPTGRYQLLVQGGLPNLVHVGPFVLATGAPEPVAPPVNVAQMVERYERQPKNTELVARLVLNSTAPSVGGEKLTQLPPNLSALMRSDRDSGVKLERDEIKTTVETPFLVSGLQQIVVNVVREDSKEHPASPFGSRSPGATVIVAPSAPPGVREPGSDVGAGDDTADAWSAGLEMQAGGAAPKRGARPQRGNRKPAQTHGEPGHDTAGSTGDQAAPIGTAAVVAGRPADNASVKPITRQLQLWRQSAESDFAAGTFNGTSVNSIGELELARTLHRLASTTDQYVWSLAAGADGSLYAGTGSSGAILKIDPSGHVRRLAKLGDVAVLSLLVDKDGALWAGTAAPGRLYRISPDGTTRMIGEAPEKYLTAIVEDSKGDLFVAAAGGGIVYELPAADKNRTDGKALLARYVDTRADHVLSLATDANDNLYVGTGNQGVLYKVTPEDHLSVLFDTSENGVTALATDASGNIYAGTGPKGMLYKISPDGKATLLFDRATAFYTGLARGPNGALYASTVRAVYRIVPEASDSAPAFLRSLDTPKDLDILGLVVLPGGRVVAATGNVGEVYASDTPSGPRSKREGSFQSPSHDAQQVSKWGTLQWDGVTAGGAGLRFDTRTGNVAEPDETWSPWAPIRLTAEHAGAVVSPPARFIQFRCVLDDAGKGRTQVGVRSVSVGFLPRNQPPQVTFQSPGVGAYWAKTQMIRWTGKDADDDTLEYSLSYSSDDGATWQPLPEPKHPAPAPGKTGEAPALRTGGASANSDSSREAPPEAVPPRVTATPGARSPSGPTRDTSLSFDTTALPDGTYRLKVVASDRPSSPSDPLTATTVSDAFTIGNTPPGVSLEEHPTANPDKSITVHGSATDAGVPVTAVQYRLDGGAPVAAVAASGLFDSFHDDFVVTTAPVPAGKHTVEVQAFNAAGSSATKSVEVVVPP